MSGAYPRPSLAWYVVGTLFIAWVLAYLDRQIITLMVPLIKADLAISDTEVSLIQGMAFAIIFAVAGLPLGRMVDRMNRRNLVVAGVALWSLATVACGFAESFAQLFAARALVGVGEACLAPATFSMLADYFHPSRRGRAMGMIAMGTAVGNAGSLFLGGLVLKWMASTDLSGVPVIGEMGARQIAFLVIGAPGVLLAALMFTIPEPVRREVATTRSSETSFLRRLRDQRGLFAPVYGVYVLNYLVGFANAVWGPVVFMRVHGMAPSDVGILIGLTTLLTGLVSGPTAGFVSDYMARRRPADGRFSLALAVLPLGALCSLGYLFADYWPAALFAYLALSFSSNFMGGTSYPALQDLVPNQLRGQVVAVYVTLASLLGYTLAPTLVALITDFVLRDEQKVAISIMAVTAPAYTLATLLAWVGLKPYASATADTRRGLEAA